MAALSCLRSRLLLFSSRKSFAGKLLAPPSSPAPRPHNAITRSMSHARTMEFVPSSFEWRKFKDHMNFYFMLGLVPIGAIIGATNIFIGPGQLIDTPEGYEPKPWEYYKSPISRFIARYVIDSQEKRYERHMHFIAQEKDKILMRKLEKKVALLAGAAGQRYDSKRWYYIPVNDRAAQGGHDVEQANEESRGFK